MSFQPRFLRHAALLSGGLLVPVLFIAGCGGGGGGSNGGPVSPTPTATPIVTPGPTFTPGPSPTPTTAPIQVPTFAFVSTRDGNPEIYVARNNGTIQTRITNNTTVDSSPSLSPNGRSIAYASITNRDANGNLVKANSEIFVQDIDGSDPTPHRYTADAGDFPPDDTNPVWSPDGGSITWTSTRGGKANIWIMDDTAENQRQFTNDATAAFDATWAPNGSRLAYFVTRGGNSNLQYIGVNANGTAGAVTTTQVSSTTGKTSPSFSPDSARLVFAQSIPQLGSSSLSIYNVATGVLSAGPNAGKNNSGPTWSRTGNIIAWSASGGTTTNRQIFASVPGSGQNRQLTTQGENYDPSF